MKRDKKEKERKKKRERKKEKERKKEMKKERREKINCSAAAFLLIEKVSTEKAREKTL